MSDTTDFRDALRSKQDRSRNGTTGTINNLDLTDDAANTADASWRRARRIQAAGHRSEDVSPAKTSSGDAAAGQPSAPPATHSAPAAPATSTTEQRWSFPGPGLRELPSPEYMAYLEEQQPGTISAVLAQVNEDIELRRRIYRDHDHRNMVHAAVRVYTCLVYAVAALCGSVALFVRDQVHPGVLLAILSAFALVIATEDAITTPLNWFKRNKTAAPTSRPAPVKKPGTSASAPAQK